MGAAAFGDPIDDGPLEGIEVLDFVDLDPGVASGGFGVAQMVVGECQQIVEVQIEGAGLERFILLTKLRQRPKLRFADFAEIGRLPQRLVEAQPMLFEKAVEFQDRFPPDAPVPKPFLFHQLFDEKRRILFVQEGGVFGDDVFPIEIAATPGMEVPDEDMMLGSQLLLDTFRHIGGGAVGEGQADHLFGRDPFVQGMDDPLGQQLGLARPRRRQDEMVTRVDGDDASLLFGEFEGRGGLRRELRTPPIPVRREKASTPGNRGERSFFRRSLRALRNAPAGSIWTTLRKCRRNSFYTPLWSG